MPSAAKLLPGIGALLTLSFLSLSLLKPEVALNDQATGRHIASGRVLLAEQEIPPTDPLSFTFPGRPYLNFEWLFDVLAATCQRQLGLPALVFLTFGLFATTLLLLLRHLLRHHIQLPSLGLFILAAASANYVHLLARPLIFTYFFLTLLVAIWNRYLAIKSTSPWTTALLLSAIFLPWANLHPGFTSGLLYLGSATLGYLWDQRKRNLRRAASRTLPLAAFAFLVTLLNPYGYHLHFQIIDIALTSKIVPLLEESAPPDFIHPNGATVFLILFLISLPLMWRPKSWRLRHLLPLILFTVFALKTQRHILLLVPITALPLAQTWNAWLPQILPQKILKKTRGYTLLTRQAKAETVWLAIFGCAIALLFFLSPRSHQLRIAEQTFSPEAQAFLSREYSHLDRPFNTALHAGALLYCFHPKYKIAFDDRVDFYGDKIAGAFLDAIHGHPGYWETIETYGFNSAILHPSEPLAAKLSILHQWKTLYRDSSAIILQRPPQP